MLKYSLVKTFFYFQVTADLVPVAPFDNSKYFFILTDNLVLTQALKSGVAYNFFLLKSVDHLSMR